MASNDSDNDLTYSDELEDSSEPGSPFVSSGVAVCCISPKRGHTSKRPRSQSSTPDGYEAISIRKTPRGHTSGRPRSESSTPDGQNVASINNTPSRIPKPIQQVRRHRQDTSGEHQEGNPQICGTEILVALGDVTSTLSKLIDRMDKQESQLKSLEQKISQPSTPSEALKVPAIVRVCLFICNLEGSPSHMLFK